MSHVFYAFAIIFIVYELVSLSSPKSLHRAAKAIRDVKKEEMTGWQAAYVFFNLGYLSWCIIGLFSSQWVIFGFILIWSNTVGRLAKYHFLIRFVNSALHLAILIFLVINTYHLGINIESILISAINGR